MDPNHSPVADSSPYHNALADGVEHWGLVAEKTELVRDGINHVFATETDDGQQVIVRISDGASRGKGELLGELTWLDHLNRHGCTVAEPLRSRGGELLESSHLDAGGYHTCCFKRFAGRSIDPATDPAWNDDLLANLGREIAGKVLGALVRGYRTEYDLAQEQLEMVEDMIRLHAVLNYIAVAPAIDHWQVAMGDPHPTAAEAMTWMEALWLRDAAFRVDLSQL